MALKLSTPGQMSNYMSKIRIFLRVSFGKAKIEESAQVGDEIVI